MILGFFKILIIAMLVYVLYSAIKLIFFPARPKRVDGDQQEPRWNAFRTREERSVPKTIVLDKDQYKVE